jgi:hypothetical protein
LREGKIVEFIKDFLNDHYICIGGRTEFELEEMGINAILVKSIKLLMSLFEGVNERNLKDLAEYTCFHLKFEYLFNKMCEQFVAYFMEHHGVPFASFIEGCETVES